MSERLAKLKNIALSPTEEENKNGFFVKPDKRPDLRQAEDLVKQMGEEVKIDEKADSTSDITERLAKLRGVSVR